LCTDDGLSTLTVLAVDRTDLELSSNPFLLYSPTEWPHELAPQRFDLIDCELRRRNEVNSDLRQHVNAAFDLLVEALRTLRRERQVRESVFLTVLSTDPSKHLRLLENAAVTTLNLPELTAGWRDFFAKWN